MATPAAASCGTRIREERERRDQRQADLAEMLDVTQVFVSQMELGRVELPSEAVRARFLECWGFDPYADRAAEREGKVSASEFARLIGVDVHSVMRLIADGVLPGRNLGN